VGSPSWARCELNGSKLLIGRDGVNWLGSDKSETDSLCDGQYGGARRCGESISQGLEMLSLVIDQPPLALQPSSVAGERTVGSYHAMTGNDDADRIGSIGQSYGAHGRRSS